ncbi:hypothetical protein B6I21_07570 [candidate division KSB1 bacterium 4572_119]|nr:MAG: hypothetical protein B6I21_07570 [candidate division KSB1 bacterium 4572_119]
MVLIHGCLNLINIPFGTALGVYTIWVLMNEESINLLKGKAIVDRKNKTIFYKFLRPKIQTSYKRNQERL